MIIWGSKGKEEVVGQGQFYCPNCNGWRKYFHKKLGQYFTLYFIPLFETKTVGEYIECQSCYTPFRTEVLQYSQSLETERTEQDAIKELITKISEELDAGVSLQAIASMIKAAGGNEEAATAAMFAATRGNIKVCKNCGTVYKDTLNYCSICGNKLITQN